MTLLCLFLVWRALVAECLDPLFLRSVSGAGPFVHYLFMVLVVLNLVGGFEALGTLLAVGIMMLPAAAARFWANRVLPMCALAVAFGVLSGAAGLLLSYHLDAASGPAIILTAGAIYLASAMFGRRGIIGARLRRYRHRTA